MGAVLITKKSAELYVDDRYTIRAKCESNLKVYSLSSLSLKGKVAVEDHISVREFASLKKNHKRAKWKITSNVVENLRAVKSAGEIREIRKASRIVDLCFSRIHKFVKVGITEMQIAQELERTAIKNGADGMAFESIVAWGANAAAPHHLSGKQKIGRDNFLLLDFGVLVNGYHSDFTRTFFIGRPNKKQEKIYNTVLEAQVRGIEKVQPENPAALVDTAARRHIERAGFGKYFTHNTGHGVGLEIHELPNFSAKSGDVLRAGMVVTVEPGIYIEGWGGVRIEDMVLVSDGGPIILSKSPKDLESMIVRV